MPRSQGTSRKGKPKKADRAAGMGRALQRAHTNKFKVKSNGSSRGAGMAASGAQSIGLEVEASVAASNKIKSILETDDLTDFLQRAELADQEFETEHERFVVVDDVAQEVTIAKSDNIILEGDEDAEAKLEQLARFDFKQLSVPRRPKWDKNTTPAELDQNERESFLNWRREIAQYEAEIAESTASRVSVTPFEKNIEVWRQLWRVLERSDCIILVIDARNPSFYISTDLRKYVEEELGKSLILVVNKCDHLTIKQRKMWHEHFKTLDGLEHVFFSAVKEQEVLDSMVDVSDGDIETATDSQCYKSDKGYPTILNPQKIGIDEPLTRKELIAIICKYAEMNGVEIPDVPDESDKSRSSRIEFGLVGFPNVGKSSVLNVLVGASKNDHSVNRVAVAAMPGKTKHFQTLNIPDYRNITLVDCPGLVFPSFVSSSADLVLAGVYPLPQVRDFWPAVELICRRISRDILEAHFGIDLPRPTALDVAQKGGALQLKAPTAEELLGTYCIARSLLAASSGVPDYYRASKVILKDYVTGALLHCHSPPHISSGGGVGASFVKLSAEAKQWQETFTRETLSTTFRRHEKLRQKMGVVETEDGEFLRNDKKSTETVDALIDDLDILEMIDMVEKPNGGNRGKSHKSMQKHGKKGRKTRNKDPYGCHTNPEDELFSNSSASGSGLIVNAGKYSKGYTRINYKGAKSAT